MYNLANGLDRERFKVKVNALYEKQGMVELVDKQPRTRSQNSYLHLILGILAMEVGESIDYIKEEIFKKQVNPDVFVYKKKNEVLGEIIVLRSTKDVSTPEMSKCIDRYRDWCAHHKIYIPSARDKDLLTQVEYELSRYHRTQEQWQA